MCAWTGAGVGLVNRHGELATVCLLFVLFDFCHLSIRYSSTRPFLPLSLGSDIVSVFYFESVHIRNRYNGCNGRSCDSLLV